ncbi:uncharacterized protein I206_103977 [Kwoniella pini CBS 10737]|uniref:Myb-like domain-containing protein n=1 Tax=Kwoniella pini CBS 10737 TaxID=1296096 RepID=A0A1B9I376_9TREE|nr:uncharacterized protein I206_04449 [Kwoniella pini CBS 10737]OCF49918.1 hypothetical protein I206_04449 [Kwoniella pini CBS 10737]
MSPVKRESSSTPSLEDIKPKVPSTPKKAKNLPKKDSSSPDKTRKAPEAWTNEEDAIFIEIIDRVLKAGLYQEVKMDGRLQRENQAVRAHLTAFMNKLKRG